MPRHRQENERHRATLLGACGQFRGDAGGSASEHFLQLEHRVPVAPSVGPTSLTAPHVPRRGSDASLETMPPVLLRPSVADAVEGLAYFCNGRPANGERSGAGSTRPNPMTARAALAPPFQRSEVGPNGAGFEAAPKAPPVCVARAWCFRVVAVFVSTLASRLRSMASRASPTWELAGLEVAIHPARGASSTAVRARRRQHAPSSPRCLQPLDSPGRASWASLRALQAVD